MKLNTDTIYKINFVRETMFIYFQFNYLWLRKCMHYLKFEIHTTYEKNSLFTI